MGYNTDEKIEKTVEEAFNRFGEALESNATASLYINPGGSNDDDPWFRIKSSQSTNEKRQDYGCVKCGHRPCLLHKGIENIFQNILANDIGTNVLKPPKAVVREMISGATRYIHGTFHPHDNRQMKLPHCVLERIKELTKKPK